MPLDMQRQARISAARKLASEMAEDAATEHLPDAPEAMEAPAEEAADPMEASDGELTPEDAQKLSQLAALMK